VAGPPSVLVAWAITVGPYVILQQSRLRRSALYCATDVLAAAARHANHCCCDATAAVLLSCQRYPRDRRSWLDINSIDF